MKKALPKFQKMCRKMLTVLLWFFIVSTPVIPIPAFAQVGTTPPQPVVAIHVSENTQALETMAAVSPTPTGAGTTGHQWWTPAWHYFVAYESLEEALRSDGTPFVEIHDSDISS